MELSAVILAGGKSSRMGQDKALLPFRGYSSMAEFQYERLKKIFNSVYISTKEDKFNFKADLIYDRYEESSPLVAIVSIFEELKCDAFFLLSVDMPFVSEDDIKKLIDSYKNERAFEVYCLKSSNGCEPTATIYTKAILNSAKEMLKENNHKLKSLIESSNYKAVKSYSYKNFININTKDEYFSYFV